MSLLQLKTVVWKNFLIRKRHYILTICEALLPILLFFVIAYGRSKIGGLNKVEINETIYSQPFKLSYYYDSISGDTQVYFTPKTLFYTTLMQTFKEKMQISNENVKGFGDQNQLEDYYYKHSNNSVLAIIFNGPGTTKLDYMLRYHEKYTSWRTDSLYDNVLLYHPDRGTHYKWKGFLTVQIALDLTYIEAKSGRTIEDKTSIQFQEFPYPPHIEDNNLTTFLMTFLPLITLFSFIFICPAVLKRVVEEKHSGIKELMKMVGMKPWMLWLGWFIYGMLPMVISIICIVLLMKVSFFDTPYPPIEFTNGMIFFLYLLLYCMAATVFCFFISTFYSKPNLAMIGGALIWILQYFVPYSLVNSSKSEVTFTMNMLLNLLPNMALHYGYSAIASYEQRGLGVQWSNWMVPGGGDPEELAMGHVCIMLVIDIILYSILTFYLDSIMPGKYGVKKSVFYPIKWLFKLFKGLVVKDVNGKIEAEVTHLQHVEEGYRMQKGIELHNLYKKFGPKVAVDNLSLDIYEGQITVLLGHNGAGKTTTMGMLTGMIDSSSGSIRMNNKDFKQHSDEIRKTLGLCPQHNLLFPDLTVSEHLEFFARLKGRTSREAKKEIEHLLTKLNLKEKASSMACTLSGGMKRKLCLGMAIVGDSQILILDEPTSGMDPESRRALWDLLLGWRESKTILITTHFMEEADVLGDWIAIMANGRLQCYGTSLYLKKKYDTGYHLSFIVEPDADTERISRAVNKYVNGAQCKSSDGNNLVFVLPFESHREFPKMFEYLEENKKDLKIETISVTITTLEDVFLKAKVENDGNSDDGSSGKSVGDDTTQALVTAGSTERRFNVQIGALARKRWFFTQKKIWTYLSPIIVNIVFLALFIYLIHVTTNYIGEVEPKLELKLGTYGLTTCFYSGTDDKTTKQLKSFYADIVEQQNGKPHEVPNVLEALVQSGTENMEYYHKHIIASAEFNKSEQSNRIDIIAYFSGMALHSPPISLNLITNALAKTYLGDEYSISLTNWPLPSVDTINVFSPSIAKFVEFKIVLLWLFLIPLGTLFTLGTCIFFPQIELSTKFTQLQFMCGVRPIVYWAVNFVVDFFAYIPLAMVMVMIIVLSWQPFTGFEQAVALFTINIAYGISGIPFAYLFSRKNSASAAFSLFLILNLFVGDLLTLVVYGLINSGMNYYINIGETLKMIALIISPQFGLTHLGMQFCTKAIEMYNLEVAPPTNWQYCLMDPNPCCDWNSTKCQEYRSYYHLLASDIAFMLLGFLIYFALIVFLNTYMYTKCKSKTVQWYYSAKNSFIGLFIRKSDTNDRDEYDNRDEDNSSRTGTMKVNKLKKAYFGKPVVKNIKFVLEKGKCLGILGVNGAGKTTTFRMLTREEYRDDGIVFADDKGIDKDEYLERLGYCPQIDSLNFVLTGRQILTLMAELRGINNPKPVVDEFLDLFELRAYADKPCGYYSGGNKRKLSLAIAIIGFPNYVLLDEPTNGVDPSARRKFWTLIKKIQDIQNTSFILTSHSMAECEALCNKLSIMKDGSIHSNGTIAELKKGFGGFSVKLKLANKASKERKSSDECDEVDGVETPQFKDVSELKEFLHTCYQGELKDEHSGLLHYYIKEKNKRWSELFTEMENIKQRNPNLIEDYAISEASLEDVFLSVASPEDAGNK